MKKKTSFKTRLFSAFLAVLFAICSISAFIPTAPVYAVPEDATAETAPEDTTTPDESAENQEENSEEEEEKEPEDTCAKQTGAVSWFVCPTTKVIANAIDSIYSILNDLLVVKPLSTDKDSPIHLVWDYVRNISNIAFIILLLIVVYSQLTGIGISNFGIKRVLPRLIIAAILVNLSWFLCTIFVDLSNIFGVSLRGFFTGIKESALASGAISPDLEISWASLLGVIISGGAITGLSVAITGGIGAFFWMLVPTLLAAIIAVIAGLLTLAARQALVSLLIMIAPLAFVAYLIPNTEKWFIKWKGLLLKMLIFYPTFSFVFGASELIGWTIILSATSGFGLILGMAVQVFPLFFAFSLMKMSDTILGGINNAVRKVGSPLQRTASGFANTERELRRQKYLASRPRNFELTKRFAQKMSDMNYRRAHDIDKYAEVNKTRGGAYAAKYRKRNGAVSRRGERLYDAQLQNLENQAKITRTAGDFDNGLGVYALSSSQKRRLNAADMNTVAAASRLKYEQERNAKISYENTVNYYKGTQSAMEAHAQSQENAKAIREGKTIPYAHIDKSALKRYGTMLSTMEGKTNDVQFIAAGAANDYDTQTKIVTGKFSKFFDLTAPTKEVQLHIRELAKSKNSSDYIDPIISGLRILNMRGDTDLIGEALGDVLDGGKVKLGTHASQSLASFLMFDVKDNDPLLRRFGKYINLETAHVFNDPINGRKNRDLSFDEYITGEYTEIYEDGTTEVKGSKRPAAKLLSGTSLDGIERTAFANLDASLKRVYGDDVKAFKEKRAEIQSSLGAAFISANLKYLSGSEQIASTSTFLTGLTQDKHGNWVKRWEDPDDPLYGFDQKYFLDQTKAYLTAQTPSQILSLRTDLFTPIMELLGLESETIAGTTLTKEERADGAKKIFRDLLDSKGTLEQIYNTRRSGAANNAKAVVRDAVGLEDEEAMLEFIAKKRAARKTAHDTAADDASSTTPSVWTETDRIRLQDEFDQQFNDDPDDPNFFDDTYKALKDTHGLGVIAEHYKDYYTHNPTVNNSDLILKLHELLDDDTYF